MGYQKRKSALNIIFGVHCFALLYTENTRFDISTLRVSEWSSVVLLFVR